MLCFVGFYALVLRLARLFRQFRKVNSANFAWKLSEKGSERRSGRVFGPVSGPERAERDGLGASWTRVSGTSVTFQTVSLRSSLKFACKE